MKKLIRFCGFLTVALKTPLRYWGEIWRGVFGENHSVKKMADYHFRVISAVGEHQRKIYYALILADTHLRHFQADDPNFAACFDDGDLAPIENVLPLYRVALRMQDPKEMVSFLNSPNVQNLTGAFLN